MNTISNKKAILSCDGENEILFPDAEFGFPKDQLNQIQRLHNNGVHYQDISEIVQRCPYEVMLALLHMVKAGRKIKPIWEVIK